MGYQLNELAYAGDLTFHQRLEPWLTLWKSDLSFVVATRNILSLDRWVLRPLLARARMILPNHFFIQGSAVVDKQYEDILHLIEHGGYGTVWVVSQGPQEQTASFLRCWSRVETWSAGDFQAAEIAELSRVNFGIRLDESETFFAFSGGDECDYGILATLPSFPAALLSGFN